MTDFVVTDECLAAPWSCEMYAAYTYDDEGEQKLFTHANYYAPNFDQVYNTFFSNVMFGSGGEYFAPVTPPGLVDPANPYDGPVPYPQEPEPEPEPEEEEPQPQPDTTPYGMAELAIAAVAGAMLVYLLRK